MAAAFSYAISNGYVADFYVQPIANPQAGLSETFSSNDGTLLSFSTIALDEDLDAAITSTDLSPVAYPAVQWYQTRYYPDDNGVTGLGEGYLQYSRNQAFTGRSGCDLTNKIQHWGDFNSGGWDPTVASPNGKQEVF